MPLQFTKRELEFIAFLLADDCKTQSMTAASRFMEYAQTVAVVRAIGFSDFTPARTAELWRKIDDNIPKT